MRTRWLENDIIIFLTLVANGLTPAPENLLHMVHVARGQGRNAK